MTPRSDPLKIAPPLLAWFDRYGRHDLPWQENPTPYRVWVSEIMLQQTQVATVIPYYERFMSRFPDLGTLAAAPMDEVLHMWTGLGYYARARNLHRASQLVLRRHGGRLPEDLGDLQALPGIGRSTAAAILALSKSRRHPILDANARRVLSRYFGIDAPQDQPVTQKRMWALAEACTPSRRIRDYTQAIMDLGASVCTRGRPTCQACPLRETCEAHACGRQDLIPAKANPRPLPHRNAFALVVQLPDGSLLLEQRPSPGVWGGLYSFPQFESFSMLEAAARDLLDGLEADSRCLPTRKHAFTHFELSLRMLLVRPAVEPRLPEGWIRFDPSSPARVGLSSAVVGFLGSEAEPSDGRTSRGRRSNN